MQQPRPPTQLLTPCPPDYNSTVAPIFFLLSFPSRPFLPSPALEQHARMSAHIIAEKPLGERGNAKLGLAGAVPCTNSHNNAIISPGLPIITTLHHVHIHTFAFDSAMCEPGPAMTTMHPIIRIRPSIHLVGKKWRKSLARSSPPAFTSTDSRFHLTRRSICSCIFFFPALAGAEAPKKKQYTCKGETKEILFYNYFFLLYISKLHFSFSVFLRTLAAPLLLYRCVSFCHSAALQY